MSAPVITCGRGRGVRGVKIGSFSSSSSLLLSSLSSSLWWWWWTRGGVASTTRHSKGGGRGNLNSKETAARSCDEDGRRVSSPSSNPNPFPSLLPDDEDAGRLMGLFEGRLAALGTTFFIGDGASPCPSPGPCTSSDPCASPGPGAEPSKSPPIVPTENPTPFGAPLAPLTGREAPPAPIPTFTSTSAPTPTGGRAGAMRGPGAAAFGWLSLLLLSLSLLLLLLLWFSPCFTPPAPAAPAPAPYGILTTCKRPSSQASNRYLPRAGRSMFLANKGA